MLTLRVEVFVVEQQAPYRELDGADLAADTTHLWIEVPAEADEPPAEADEPEADEPEADEPATRGEEPALGPVVAGTGRRLVATARLVTGRAGAELGRVVVASAHRERGLGTALVQTGCELAGRPLHLNAQTHLESWYAAFGFVTVGPPFDWEGIAHVPMRLSA